MQVGKEQLYLRNIRENKIDFLVYPEWSLHHFFEFSILIFATSILLSLFNDVLINNSSSIVFRIISHFYMRTRECRHIDKASIERAHTYTYILYMDILFGLILSTTNNEFTFFRFPKILRIGKALYTTKWRDYTAIV